jgi:hypothetical protein
MAGVVAALSRGASLRARTHVRPALTQYVRRRIKPRRIPPPLGPVGRQRLTPRPHGEGQAPDLAVPCRLLAAGLPWFAPPRHGDEHGIGERDARQIALGVVAAEQKRAEPVGLGDAHHGELVAGAEQRRPGARATCRAMIVAGGRPCCRRARAYVRGLLAPLAGKNGWTLAEVAGDLSPDGTRLLNAASRDVDGVRDDVRGYVVEHLGDPAGVLMSMTADRGRDRFLKKVSSPRGCSASTRARRAGSRTVGSTCSWPTPPARAAR